MLADLREDLRDAGRVFSSGRAWTTREVEEWIRFALCARGGQDDDFQVDLAAFSRGAVFVDFERAALCFALNALDVAVFQDERLRAVLPDGAGAVESKHHSQ